jgi:predicted RNA-binding Zn-ribbon protein involved in translation (DUF1610 family)
MKTLLLDLETAPMLGYSWDIWKEQGSMKFIVRDWYMLCWAAKWLDNKKIMSSALPDFKSYTTNPENDYNVVYELWKLLQDVDVVITQNGIKFDIPKSNAKFIEHGLTPPPPFKMVDTCQIARNKFGFTSNKLDDIARLLKVGKKSDTGGFDLWANVMNGDMKAWKKMVEYNKNDVLLLEKIYKRMLPFINNHPNINVYEETLRLCPKCGSNTISKRGFSVRISGKVQRYQCVSCGGWCVGEKILKNAI